jgi:AcrR family transcriptional regulator
VPTPARTSNEQIIGAARALLNANGLESVTMKSVAAGVGVQPPSLYKRIRDRSDLIRQLANSIGNEFADTLESAATTGDPARDLHSIANTFRDWVRHNASAYALLTSPVPDEWRVDDELNARMSASFHGAASELVGPDRALDAARTFAAFAHGFVSLETAGTMRLGGDLDTAYEFGINAVIRAIRDTGARARDKIVLL